MSNLSQMTDKQQLELAAAVAAARVNADAKRRWEEVRNLRQQVQSRQDQVLQQTSAEVRRHVERMRVVRSSIVNAEPARSGGSRPTIASMNASDILLSEAAAGGSLRPSVTTVKPTPVPQRFDFDARRAAWEQRRQEQAEKRRAEIARLNEPYQEIRRQLEEKKRLAREQAVAARPR